MKKFSLLFLALLIVLATGAKAQTKQASINQQHCLRWRLLETERTQDGGTESIYELSLPTARNSLDALEVFYTITPQQRIRPQGLRLGEQKVYTKALTGQGRTWLLNIYSGHTAKVEAWARLEWNGKTQVARTILSTFGDSGVEDAQATRLSTKPPWPSLNLASPPEYFFRAQAKSLLPFVLNAPIQKEPPTVMAHEEETTTLLKRQLDGMYPYIPPDYPIMETPHYAVFRDVLVVASLPEGAVFSYYLPVYRARHGHLYALPGLGLLLVSALITFIWIFLKGRRFKWR